MCGINGIYNFSGIALRDETRLIRQMNAAIAHRGPDDTGIWSDPRQGICLGHQRLSILDLTSAGHQPMMGRHGSVVVFNGEIYNFRSLRDSMPDERFLSDSDTEVLHVAYDRQGEHCLDEFNGMFAFAIWDAQKEELFLARDRIGKKPLYYTTAGGVFAFSSEIKALLTLPWVRAELDEEALYHFLTFNGLMAPQTMFRNIHKFHPGYKMRVGKQGIKAYEPYWEISYRNLDQTPADELEHYLLEELRQSVRLRMVSDVPVGAFLSGGVDSSAIVGLMTEQSSIPVTTYSIGFENAAGYDELEHARGIARQFNTRHHEKMVRPDDLRDLLPKIVEIFDEPLADATAIPIYFISQLARENRTIVVLTGDGADELFCGYRHWQQYARFYPYYRLFAGLPATLKRTAVSLFRHFDESSPFYELLSRAAIGQEFFWGGASGFKEATKKSFLSRAYAERMAALDSHQLIARLRAQFEQLPLHGRHSGYADWMSFLGLKHIIPDRFLYRADRLGMANSIEIRTPFLDYGLVNYAMSVPGGMKIRGGEPKYVLKKALEPVLSRQTLYRRKQGFCVPLYEWTGDVILNYVEQNLPRFCRDTGLFDEERLRAQVRATKAGNQNYIFTLWNIYFLMAWFRRWIP
ncbi:MAG: asparagine synthase (glutamine-hydrolyzing) [Pseudomonadota bacterium]